jgi:hypothetical protein
MAVLFLPMVKMYLQLCPSGAEGATYAMLTTYGEAWKRSGGGSGAFAVMACLRIWPFTH